ncbi:uncharacterized protein LOC143209463 isoform X1 [Lasioglossum baleicum]|uniref:uncharacterized protein LOC143209463 isoform X1 n=1 Tax=Lasioglossum baleicum TaxID=434251 RepID=UPI003FCEC7ED
MNCERNIIREPCKRQIHAIERGAGVNKCKCIAISAISVSLKTTQQSVTFPAAERNAIFICKLRSRSLNDWQERRQRNRERPEIDKTGQIAFGNKVRIERKEEMT